MAAGHRVRSTKTYRTGNLQLQLQLLHQQVSLVGQTWKRVFLARLSLYQKVDGCVDVQNAGACLAGGIPSPSSILTEARLV